MAFDFKKFLEKTKTEANKKGTRKANTKKLREFILIVCEGTKTEPNYFTAIKKRLPKGVVDKLVIKGTGRNTNSLIKEAVAHVEARKKSTAPDFDQIWIVFDRDAFSKKQVNDACSRINDLGFSSAFSNEAFELWYILHFEYLDAKIDRKAYIKYLNKIFKKHKLGKYEKNSEDIYEILENHGDQTKAISHASRLLELHGDSTPYESQPSTRVHQLVALLNEFM